MIEHKDFLGNLIRVGDLVVYPVRKGSWMALRTGWVHILGWDDGLPFIRVRLALGTSVQGGIVKIKNLQNVIDLRGIQ